MTEERKKPRLDQVTDEQLEDVAGGNVASKGGSGLAFPDVCSTPEGEASTPVAFGGTASKTDPTKGGTDSTGGITPNVGTNSLEDGITRL